MYKLICCDLDGTLFDKNKNITDENIKEIKSLYPLGIHFVVASGRPLSGVLKVNETLGLNHKDDTTICYNGAIILDNTTKKILFKKMIKGSDVKKLYKESLRLKTDFHFFDEAGNLYTPKKNEYTAVEEKINHLEAKVIDISTIDDNALFIKAMMVSDEKTLDNAMSLISNEFNYLNMVRSSKIFLEFLNKEASKGNALLFLKDYYHLDSNMTMAIGDADNDKSMLISAKMGVAMKNSFCGLEKYADFITKSNEESGVAYAIKELVKKERN